MSYSSLATAYIPAATTNYKKGRSGYKVCKITIHHMAGKLSAAQCGSIFQNPTRKASSNYGIGVNGEIACYVDEENRSYCSSSAWNDNQAITIEVANDNTSTWSISQASYDSLIRLCADICKRYGFTLVYTGDKNGTLTRHCFYASTDCPGPYIKNNTTRIVTDVNNTISGSKYYAGQRVLIDAPIGDNIPDTDKVRVVSNGYPFVVHKTVAKVYGLGDVLEVLGNGLYKVKIFEDEFFCREEYMSDKY